MADEDIRLPPVPQTLADDPEDVSWALSTAEAMWARGDHSEALKWIRKAAESAADAEADERALQLAKAASELAGLVAKRSPAPYASSARGVPPAAYGSGATKSPSYVRAPFPQTPPQKPGAPSPSRIGPAGTIGGSLASTPRPPSVVQRPMSAKSSVAHAPAPEAPPSPSPSTRQVRPSVPRYDSEATMVGQIQSYVDSSSRLPPIDEDDDDWETGGETTMHASYVDRPTSHEARALPAPMRPPMASTPRHDPEISTSQAVRVVVWRDANGVHVAPAGTVVSAITVDAILVALEPNTDLTAWLSVRQR